MPLFDDALGEVFTETIETGEFGYCITFEMVNDHCRWVQVTGQYLNIAYPFSVDPVDKMLELGIEVPEEVDISEWKPDEFVTFWHEGEPTEPIAKFLRQFVGLVLEMPENLDLLKKKAEWL